MRSSLNFRICDKAESAGRTIILVDPKGTSQICSNCQEMVDKDLHQRTYLPALWIQRGQGCQRSEEHALPCIIHPTTRSTGWTGHPFRHLIGRMAVRTQTQKGYACVMAQDLTDMDSKYHPTVRFRFDIRWTYNLDKFHPNSI